MRESLDWKKMSQHLRIRHDKGMYLLNCNEVGIEVIQIVFKPNQTQSEDQITSL